MCILDAMLVLYTVGGAALGFTGMRLYKDYKKSGKKDVSKTNADNTPDTVAK